MALTIHVKHLREFTEVLAHETRALIFDRFLFNRLLTGGGLP
jgi:hypothetical protein